MIKKQRLTIVLTALSLLSILTMQGYFLRSDFLANQLAFQNDVNVSLELIIEDVQNDREDREYELHKNDLMDSTLLRIEYEPVSQTGTTIRLIDVITEDKVLTFSFIKAFNPDTMTKEALFEKIFRWKGLEKRAEKIYFGLGVEIDTRMEVYRDTLSANRKLLDSLLTERFADYNIQSDYNVIYLPKDSSYHKNGSEFVTTFFELDDKQTTSQVGVIIPQPFWGIVRRSSAVIIASFSAILLVLSSFWFLNRVIVRQRNLAEAKDDFIDNVTHELLTPISTLSISLESLDKYNALNDKKKAQDYLSISQMELKRITGLVKNVLQVSLHDQGEIKLNMINVELISVLHDLINNYTMKSGDAVNFDVDSQEEVWVLADVYHLKSVLYNLVDNAMNYSNRHTNRIRFRVQTGNQVVLEVQDNGYGVPHAEQEKIFDKFHRVSQKGLHEVKGMGIGLYYAKTIMAKMKGNLNLKESSENGSTFCLSFQNGERESNG